MQETENERQAMDETGSGRGGFVQAPAMTALGVFSGRDVAQYVMHSMTYGFLAKPRSHER